MCARPVALRGARHPPLSPPASLLHNGAKNARVNFAAEPPLLFLLLVRLGSCRSPLRGSLRLAVRSARASRRFTPAHRSPPAVPPVAHSHPRAPPLAGALAALPLRDWRRGRRVPRPREPSARIPRLSRYPRFGHYAAIPLSIKKRVFSAKIFLFH